MKAAAWSVPIIALAASTPAAAASTGSLSITPVAPQAIAPGATSATYTVTLAPPVVGGVADKTVNVVITGGGFVLGTGPGGSSEGSFVTNGSGQVTFVVTSTGTGAAMGTITATSPAATGPVSVNIFTIGFAGWGYNVSDQGQVRTGVNLVLSPHFMLDTIATTGVTAMGGTYAALIWADQLGNLWVRGFNSWGEIGWNGTTANSPAPARAKTIGGADLDKQIVHIARGTGLGYSIAVASDGTVWAAGRNLWNAFANTNYTEFGNGWWQQITTDEAFFTARNGATVTQAEFNMNTTALYLLSDGRVLASGVNSNGVSAQGTTGGTVVGGTMKLNSTTPITGATSVGLNNYAAAVVVAGGALYTVGLANNGGNGGSYLTQKTLPPGKSAAKVIGGQNSMFVLMTDGTVWGLGDNITGSLGTGSGSNVGGTFTQAALPAGSVVTDVKYADGGTVFLLSTGAVYFAGNPDTGGRGDGTIGAQVNTPVLVPLPGTAKAIGANWFDSYYAFL